MDRALLDEQVTGISMSSMSEDGQVMNLASKKAVSDMRKKFVSDSINKVDLQFGRTLGCRMSRLLGQFVDPENHIRRNERGWKRVRGKWRVNNYPAKGSNPQDRKSNDCCDTSWEFSAVDL
jgi:hypothetical protein